jgi:hypothetical protein
MASRSVGLLPQVKTALNWLVCNGFERKTPHCLPKCEFPPNDLLILKELKPVALTIII